MALVKDGSTLFMTFVQFTPCS